MIRLAYEEDKQQIMDLWAYCFDDSPEFMDFYFKKCYKANNTLVVFSEGKILSSLQLLPYKIHMRGKPVELYYVVGVATWPEYRGRGHAAALLHHAVKLMIERGIYISILLPFQYDFYRKYGWEICYSFLTYKDINLWPQKTEQENIYYEKIDINRHIGDISACYDNFMERFNGYIIRSKSDWMKILIDANLDNGRGYLLRENNNTKGYILYTIQDKTLRILELIYTDIDAKTLLLQLALSHKGQVEQVLWKAPLTDITYLSMKDSRGCIEKETFVMGRILDPERALTGLSGGCGSLTVKINDSFYKANNKCFLIKSDGHLTVQQINDKPHAEMTIQTLSQLLWGYIDTKTAIHDGLIRCYDENAAAMLHSLLPEKNTYIIEEY